MRKQWRLLSDQDSYGTLCFDKRFFILGDKKMSNFQVRDIFEQNILDGARLAAGEKGIGNRILWVNFMEILDALDSLQKGELLVTTGFQLNDENRFHDLILRLKSRGVCAAAIQTGYYIHEIPEYIINSANQYDFPIIELPSQLTFSNIMHVLMENINPSKGEEGDAGLTKLKNKYYHLAEAFFNDELSSAQEMKSFLIFSVSSISSNASQSRALQQEAAEKMKICLLGYSSRVDMETYKDKAVYLISLRDGITVYDVTAELMHFISHLSREERLSVWAGISIMKNDQNAEKAFDQAYQTYQSLRDIGAKKGVCSYEDLKFFEWFDHFQKKSNSLSFSYDILKPIISYDSFHNTEYLRTLRVFFINNCKISETAQKLFIHRHTLANRLEKIRRLCSLDFENYFLRMHFVAALMIYDYFLS